MMKFEVGTIAVDNGDELLFSDFEHGGKMWSGDGQRETRVAVSFTERFSAAPVVMVAASMFDGANQANIRFDIKADEISPQGFEIVFRTWGDSRIARARAAWQAIGSVSSEEIWDV